MNGFAPELPAHVARYARFFEEMSAARVPALAELVTDDVHFRDPFNDVRGARAMMRIMAHMYETCDQADFRVIDTMAGGVRAFLTWEFDFRPRRMRGAAWHVDGATALTFAADGRVSAHIDYWDAGSQFYGRLPVLGRVIRMLRRRLQVAPQA